MKFALTEVLLARSAQRQIGPYTLMGSKFAVEKPKPLEVAEHSKVGLVCIDELEEWEQQQWSVA